MRHIRARISGGTSGYGKGYATTSGQRENTIRRVECPRRCPVITTDKSWREAEKCILSCQAADSLIKYRN